MLYFAPVVAPFIRHQWELLVAIFLWEIGCAVIAAGLWKFWRG